MTFGPQAIWLCDGCDFSGPKPELLAHQRTCERSPVGQLYRVLNWWFKKKEAS